MVHRRPERQELSPVGEQKRQRVSQSGGRPRAACRPIYRGRVMKWLAWDGFHHYSNEGALRSFRWEYHGDTGVLERSHWRQRGN